MRQEAKKIGGKWSAQVPDFARRIGEAARARRAALFRSAVRGEMGKRGDLDFLVVIPAGRHRRRAWNRANAAMGGLNRPAMDIVAAREEWIRKRRDNPCMVFKPALDEGVEVWRAEE